MAKHEERMNKSDQRFEERMAKAEARAAKTDLLLIDTAGRLHNKTDLMQELAKMARVLKK